MQPYAARHLRDRRAGDCTDGSFDACTRAPEVPSFAFTREHMPHAPKRPCRYHGCPALVDGGGYCPAHQRDVYRTQDQRRGSSSERGYDARWQRYRLGFLRRNPLCVLCLREGRTVPATVVDHVTPHKLDQRLLWSPDNHMAICKPHHDAKTAREAGTFGRAPAERSA